ncbi:MULTISPECIES: hypothetical protein [Clostridium]|uniref:hypothetical protein n=1 Tax=Clostridium TaxID=1485 RepID=UPI00036FF37A|nr:MULTISPECIES: hypothetical protein [Clostridium]
MRVPVSLSAVAKNDMLKYKGSGGKNDIGADYSASIGYGIGSISKEFGTGKFHSYINKSNKCSCDFLEDTMDSIYNCVDSKSKGIESDLKVQFGASLYFILGGNVSGAFNLAYFDNEYQHIWKE